jgi:hypothetical protein
MIQECKFYWNAWDWGINEDDRVQLHFRLAGIGDKERWVTVQISDLYANRDNARLAVIAAKRRIIQSKQAELADLERDPSKIPVNY